ELDPIPRRHASGGLDGRPALGGGAGLRRAPGGRADDRRRPLARARAAGGRRDRRRWRAGGRASRRGGGAACWLWPGRLQRLPRGRPPRGGPLAGHRRATGVARRDPLLPAPRAPLWLRYYLTTRVIRSPGPEV